MASPKRRISPKNKNKDKRDKQQKVEEPKVVEPVVLPTPTPSSSKEPNVPFPLGRRVPVVRRPMEPLPVDERIQNQIKAAEIAYMATQFVMAVCFIFVPYTCYKSMFYLPPQEQMGMGGEPWEQYFELI
ncbi:hypothetical protein PRIPAC_96134 [Pristionchus pacificus]|uniref:Uncharacterized protein n=1 Tax=Pristionchus pacificus TaxID=54126 RepID=A0A454XUA0_PRIPA|nr:hypothetical protein PRIPAC_96134 [Pristionchus pacificus]|eukprot:PDM60181.1 hypothetical protein PRIPAC_54006 [Pristionchus pacificus]